MGEIQIKRSFALNQFDSVKYQGKPRTFHLEEKNDTEQELILIYMYYLPKFSGHGIKVGMTKCRIDETFWHAIKSRIKNQVRELALPEDYYERYGMEREVIYWGVCLDARNESFKDYRVHDEIMSKCAGLVEKEQEWFQNVPSEDLIAAFESCRNTNTSKDIYVPRKEQRKCVDALLDYFKGHKTGGRFLLNCKMRYGKSFTTYKYCEEAGLKKILILTFIPAVESSWREDLTHIEADYAYYTDENLRKPSFDPKTIADPFITFLSLQNYLGKDRNSQDTKDKIKKLQGVDWDLVILDEYHFGAWNERTQGTLENQEDLDKDYQSELRKTKDVLERFSIKTKQTICLSGTPFKAIAKGEFGKENTFTYSYFDEQRNKYPNSGDNDFTTINSDYAHFPDMKIFGYNMSRLFGNMTASVFSGDKLYGKTYFSLNKFFETRRDSNLSEPCTFIYEDEIKLWLEIIKGRSVFGDKFPYSNPRMMANSKHTLWLLPKVNAVHAMAKLLREDDYFSRYQIIDLSENGVGTGVDAFDYLNDNITAANNTGRLGSIALTVNKLTIGVTVKEWSSVFVLKDLASPEQYFQSIFRIQTPYKERGQILKKDGFVYDFNIDRASALLLRYAEQSEESSVTKLDIAKLIVKYLPIFMNGDMSTPISEGVFYELAELGDTSGIPLSRKIVDTSKTTRMLDDEVIASMLSDNEVSDIIKRVFAHAKFGKTKTQTMPLRHEQDGFQTKIAKKGRDEGYRLGMDDFEKYVDYDNVAIQAAFEETLADYLAKFCPEDLGEDQRLWWSNGFIKGYEGGVNAPIKKMKCGKDDGTKFADEVRRHFGKGIVWKEETKRQIIDFIHRYLNDINNIPEKYRGALYKRWYCDSFKAAVRAELSPKIPVEKGKTIEDADNVMKHILARLFEFLYISVYRETTFQEIFANADPNVFLEAVGITKKDFEILNKYHIFQENILNNYIHQFFVNESLGSKLNLEDEEIKRQYRNSFDWFGFGLEPEGGSPAADRVEADAKEFARTIIEKPRPALSEEPNTSELRKPRYYLAYGSNLNRNRMAQRCPTAKRVGTAFIDDYRLMFKRSTSGYYLTIEEALGHKVPVGVFVIMDSDERALDGYEGYPDVYYKKDFRVLLNGEDGRKEEIDAFAYILPESRELGIPEDWYVEMAKEGYRNFGFDERLIDEALAYSKESVEIVEKPLFEERQEQSGEFSLVQRIVDLLEKNPRGLKSSQISAALNVPKKDINQALYSEKTLFSMNLLFVWTLRRQK